MFFILSRSIRNATRMNTWDAPDHWHRQHREYLDRLCGQCDRAARLRATLQEPGLK